MPGRGGRLPAKVWVLEDRCPGRTDGEGGVDQADVGVGLGEIAELGAGLRDEMFGKESEMIRAGEDLGHDLLRFRHPSEARQALNDPEGADDEAGLRPAEIIGAKVAEVESGFFPARLYGERPRNAVHGGLAYVAVGKAKDRRLRQ